MKKSKKILLIALILLVALYIVLRIKRPDEKQSPVFGLDSLAIASVEIYDQADTLKLQKSKDTWNLMFPVVWKADTLRVSNLFHKVLMAKSPKTAMGTGTQAVENYRLKDNQALHIIVGDAKGKKKVHVLFSNLGNPYDYFRYAGDDKVYQIKTKVSNSFSPDLAYWRAADVVQVAEETMDRIEVKHPKNSYTLTRKGYEWSYKDARTGFPIPPNNLAIMKIVHLLSNIDSFVFIDGSKGEYQDKFLNPACEVTIYMSNKTTKKLSFALHEDKNYLMMVDNDQTVLFLVSTDSVYRFLRSAEIFKMRGYLPG